MGRPCTRDPQRNFEVGAMTDHFGQFLVRLCAAVYVCACGRTINGRDVHVLDIDLEYNGFGLPYIKCSCGRFMEGIDAPANK